MPAHSWIGCREINKIVDFVSNFAVASQTIELKSIKEVLFIGEFERAGSWKTNNNMGPD